MVSKMVARVDKGGRVYLPQSLREAAGISTSSVLEIEAHEGEVILKKRQPKVAESSRGLFKLRVRVEDVDQEIRRLSAERMENELNEIRGR